MGRFLEMEPRGGWGGETRQKMTGLFC